MINIAEITQIINKYFPENKDQTGREEIKQKLLTSSQLRRAIQKDGTNSFIKEMRSTCKNNMNTIYDYYGKGGRGKSNCMLFDAQSIQDESGVKFDINHIFTSAHDMYDEITKFFQSNKGQRNSFWIMDEQKTTRTGTGITWLQGELDNMELELRGLQIHLRYGSPRFVTHDGGHLYINCLANNKELKRVLAVVIEPENLTPLFRVEIPWADNKLWTKYEKHIKEESMQKTSSGLGNKDENITNFALTLLATEDFEANPTKTNLQLICQKIYPTLPSGYRKFVIQEACNIFVKHDKNIPSTQKYVNKQLLKMKKKLTSSSQEV